MSLQFKYLSRKNDNDYFFRYINLPLIPKGYSPKKIDINQSLNFFSNLSYSTFAFDCVNAYLSQEISKNNTCTLLTLFNLFQDIDKTPFAKKDTFKKIELFKENKSINSEAKKLILNAFNFESPNSFVNQAILESIFKDMLQVDKNEAAIFTIDLNQDVLWPVMMKVLYYPDLLDSFVKVFRPIIKIDENYKIIIPSRTFRELYLINIFGEKQLTYPVDCLGVVSNDDFLETLSFGGHVINLNFPGQKELKEADGVNTEKFFFTEHDWDHVEKSTMIPKLDKLFFTEVHKLIFQPLHQFSEQSNTIIWARISQFGDLEFSAYINEWSEFQIGSKEEFKTDDILNLFNETRNERLLFIFFRILAVPLGVNILLSELEVIHKFCFKDEPYDGEKLLSQTQINKLNNSWYENMDSFIKKIFIDFKKRKRFWINKFKFDIDQLDWLIIKESTQKLFNKLKLQESSEIQNYTIRDFQNLIVSFKEFLDLLENQQKESDSFDDVKINSFSFQKYKIETMKIIAKKGVDLKVIKLN